MSLATIIATMFGIGRLRPAPGTWGSLVATALAWALLDISGPWGLTAGFILVLTLGTWAAGHHEKQSGRHDASEVVIDEVAGVWLTLLPVAFLMHGNMGWPHYLAGFVAFRIFDIWKPWPIRTLDRVIPGGFGTMIDDLAAAIPAGIVLWAFYKSLLLL